MELLLEPGKYVVAVSGGVDSMVLLHMLQQQPGLKLIVAHFDHGIRQDSSSDRAFVGSYAKTHGLQFEYAEGHLGPGASEDRARQVRYEFLHDVRERHDAKAIIVAHHQDDVLETAIMNMLRGTGRKGLTSLQSHDVIERPLLGMTKQQVIAYATQHDITWREDCTNNDTTYMRNYIRAHIVSKLTNQERASLLKNITDLQTLNGSIDLELQKYLGLAGSPSTQMERSAFIILPYSVAREVMAEWLRQNGLRSFDKKTIERLVVGACTLRPGQSVDITAGALMQIDAQYLRIILSNTSSNTRVQSV